MEVSLAFCAYEEVESRSYQSATFAVSLCSALFWWYYIFCILLIVQWEPSTGSTPEFQLLSIEVVHIPSCFSCVWLVKPVRTFCAFDWLILCSEVVIARLATNWGWAGVCFYVACLHQSKGHSIRLYCVPPQKHESCGSLNGGRVTCGLDFRRWVQLESIVSGGCLRWSWSADAVRSTEQSWSLIVRSSPIISCSCSCPAAQTMRRVVIYCDFGQFYSMLIFAYGGHFSPLKIQL